MAKKGDKSKKTNEKAIVDQSFINSKIIQDNLDTCPDCENSIADTVKSICCDGICNGSETNA